jgi:hypothetical protein
MLFVVCLSTLSSAQTKEIPVHYYFSTDDLVQDRVSTEEIILEVKSMGPQFIYIKDVLDQFTGKRSERGHKAYAIEYNGHPYVNLLYSYNTKTPNLYVRFDILGRFCLAVLEENFLNSMFDSQPYSGGGLAGYSLQASVTKGGKFLDKEGNTKKIFIIDTKDLSIVVPYTVKYAPLENLTKSALKWLVGKDNFKGSTSDYTVEEIIAIVEDLNRRQ